MRYVNSKRARKKLALENKVATLETELEELTGLVARDTRLLEELYNISNRNAEATNKRLDAVDSKCNNIKIDLDKAVIEFKRKRRLFR